MRKKLFYLIVIVLVSGTISCSFVPSTSKTDRPINLNKHENIKAPASSAEVVSIHTGESEDLLIIGGVTDPSSTLLGKEGILDMHDPVLLDYRNNQMFQSNNKRTKIAMLIPLTGDFKTLGLDIQSGILKRYFQALNDGVQIHFYDSNISAIGELYQDLSHSAYDVIVGPLLTSQIDKIRYSTSVINIPLNRTTQSNTFPLNFRIDNPDEVKQIIQTLTRLDYQNILLLSEHSLEGAKMTDLLASYWFRQGKNVRHILFLGDNIDKNVKKIKKYLTSTDRLRSAKYNSAGNYQFKRNATRDDFPFIRQDVDVIVASLEAKQVRPLNPLMKVIGGDSLPIYATSLLARSADFNAKKDKNLNGVYFLDSTWRYDPHAKDFFTSIGQDIFNLALAIRTYPRLIYKGLTSDYYVNVAIGLRKRQHWYQFVKNRVTKTSIK